MPESQKQLEGQETLESSLRFMAEAVPSAPFDFEGVEPMAEKPSPASSLEKKVRRAERFGVPVQLSEEEKRSSRAERFGTGAPSAGKDVENSEEHKRKARAERFGLGQSSTDEDVKKKSRLERFSETPKPNALEEEKRKARAIRFSGTSNASSGTNAKVSFEVELLVNAKGS